MLKLRNKTKENKKIKKNILKKLQLVTASLFILTILIMIIGLILIAFYHGTEEVTHHSYNNLQSWQSFVIKYNGFDLLIKYNLFYILSHKIVYFNEYGSHFTIKFSENGSLIQLKIGMILCKILTPILTFIIIILVIIIKILKKNKPNNNFWDAIQNCEIINNYYIH